MKYGTILTLSLIALLVLSAVSIGALSKEPISITKEIEIDKAVFDKMSETQDSKTIGDTVVARGVAIVEQEEINKANRVLDIYVNKIKKTKDIALIEQASKALEPFVPTTTTSTTTTTTQEKFTETTLSEELNP